MTAPLLILDSATLYYRAFYALPEKMIAPDGQPHNAIRGFLSMLTKLVALHSPAGLVAAWDTSWRPDWRVALLPSYKAHRVQAISTPNAASGIEITPDTLSPQIDAIGQILDACGVARIGFPDFEADDVIASLANQSRIPSLAVTSDKDLFQIVDDTTSVLLQTSGGVDGWPIYRPDQVLARFGITARQYVDFAALRGDPSDGLPGVPGIGDKTASALISSFGNLQRLRDESQNVKPKDPLTPRLAQKIRDSETYLDAAQQVITAEISLPVHHWDQSLPSQPHDRENLQKLSQDWGVEKFIKDLFQALDR